ncbi:hypothetical protein H0H87_003845 [Tephrocybe sp. NHM501043]|nr:hypothetical protein H0H87_003845 [Tephrocybe sp. NHM501043]
MWPLTLQRTVLLQKTIQAPTEAVLALLHDPNVLFATSPLITNVIPDSTDPSNTSYTVTDTISFAGLFKFQTKFRCRLVLLEDGVDSDVDAGFGTKLVGQYRVKAAGDDVTELSEETIVESTFFMLPYVLKTFKAAHTTGLDALAAKAEKRPSRSLKPPLFQGSELTMHLIDL